MLTGCQTIGLIPIYLGYAAVGLIPIGFVPDRFQTDKFCQCTEKGACVLTKAGTKSLDHVVHLVACFNTRTVGVVY
jgi:hypothetical protein